MHGKAFAVVTCAVLALGAAAPAAGYWIRDCWHGNVWSGQTAMVADINPGPADAVYALFGFAARDELMTVYHGSLFFQADDGKAGPELWRTAAGVAAKVAELVPGPEGSSPHTFAVFQDRLYFAATTPATGEELFRFDGATATLAADLKPGSEGGEIFGLTVYDGALYFVRTPETGGQQVWRFDGTSAAQVAAINAAPGRVPGPVLGQATFVPFAGKLYFVRETPVPEHYELWVYDGSTASKFKALTSGDHIVGYDFDLGVHQGALYFGVVSKPLAQTPWQQVDELWRYTGSGTPTRVAALDTAWSGSQPRYFQTYHGKLYFTSDSHLYRYDGSTLQDLTAATPGVPDHVRNLTYAPSTGRLFLSGYDGGTVDQEPYLYDGMGAQLVADIMPNTATPNAGSQPTVAETADGLYFFAEDETHGRELWRLSGEQIPRILCDIVVGPIWDDWREWPLDRREVVVVTWRVEPDAAARLVSREAVTMQRGREWRTQVVAIDPGRGAAPDGFGLATVVFDRGTGKRLDQGFDVVGALPARTRVRMERTAAQLVNGTSFKEALAAPVERKVEHR